MPEKRGQSRNTRGI